MKTFIKDLAPVIGKNSWKRRFDAFAVCLALSTMPTSLSASQVNEGQPAPLFVLPHLSDNPTPPVFSLAAHAGKVVALDFWATWCAPCKKALPHWAELSKLYPDLVVVAINLDSKKVNALRYLKVRPLPFPALYDADQAVATQYGVAGMPSALLIDKSGVIRYRHDGYTGSGLKLFESQIRILLEEIHP